MFLKSSYRLLAFYILNRDTSTMTYFQVAAKRPEQRTYFTCTALPINKAGELPMDEHGYRLIPVGGLNVCNSQGHFYTAEKAAKLFDDSSHLQRRIKSASLFGEAGHPKQLPGQSMDEYLERILTIEETNVSHHLREVYLDYNSIKDERGAPVVAMMAWVKGEGPHAAAMESSLGNKFINTAYSIRSFTEDMVVAAVRNRDIKHIVTWDWVIEPGIAIARKYKSPKLESLDLGTEAWAHEKVMEINRSALTQMVSRPVTAGMESARRHGIELFQSLGWNVEAGDLPAYAKW